MPFIRQADVYNLGYGDFGRLSNIIIGAFPIVRVTHAPDGESLCFFPNSDHPIPPYPRISVSEP